MYVCIYIYIINFIIYLSLSEIIYYLYIDTYENPHIYIELLFD